MNNPKISIITITYNSEKTLDDTIKSVLSQNYKNIEYIIVDGNSKDSTIDIVKSYGDKISKFVSEKDSGIYDAMNKGLRLATGDVVGILNSDDFYSDENVIQKIVTVFEENPVDSVFADLIYVKPNDLTTTTRYYDSSYFSPGKFKYGWMPAHPTFFVKRRIYQQYGLFDTTYKIAADYELLTRFLGRYHISYFYIKEALVTMRLGGISTRNLKSNFILNHEIIRACKENGIYTNWLMVLSKYPQKLLGLLKK